MPSGYIAAVLDPQSREVIRSKFPPSYEKFVGHHVTLRFGVSNEMPLPTIKDARVVGYVNDGDGVEALLVSIDGNINRPDGSYYHITWSLADHRKPKDSNKIIQDFYNSRGSANMIAYEFVVFDIPINLDVQFIQF